MDEMMRVSSLEREIALRDCCAEDNVRDREAELAEATASQMAGQWEIDSMRQDIADLKMQLAECEGELAMRDNDIAGHHLRIAVLGSEAEISVKQRARDKAEIQSLRMWKNEYEPALTNVEQTLWKANFELKWQKKASAAKGRRIDELETERDAKKARGKGDV
jgi:chromosome segregation ATPase